MSNITDKLPTIPSELVQVALDDMKATIAAGYKIDMSEWGTGIGTKDCAVCLGGAVLINTLKVESDRDNELGGWSSNISKNDEQMINALDSIRRGSLRNFIKFFNMDIIYKANINTNGMIDRYIDGWKEYHRCESDEQFYKQLEDVILILKNKGV